MNVTMGHRDDAPNREPFADASLSPGRMVTPHLRLVRQLGQGGMGTVWAAEHLTLKCELAVKFMSPLLADSEESRDRFSLEAAAAAQVKSPHVVQVLDYGVSDQGLPYIAMELVQGIDLRRYLDRNGRMPLPAVAVVVSHVARALARAHARGIIHRDIKPENVFLCDVGGDEVFVKVLDFGIAKQRDTLSRLTLSGIVVGTPYYMSPEQLLTRKDPDHHVDLWALAVVAYDALTGELPFPGETVAAVALQLARSERPVPSRVVPGLPPSVDAWFLRAFAAKTADRFQSAREMADALLEAARTRLSDPPRLPLNAAASLPSPASERLRATTEPTGHPTEDVGLDDVGSSTRNLRRADAALPAPNDGFQKGPAIEACLSVLAAQARVTADTPRHGSREAIPTKRERFRTPEAAPTVIVSVSPDAATSRETAVLDDTARLVRSRTVLLALAAAVLLGVVLAIALVSR